MPLKWVLDDVLDVNAEALLLTVDGLARNIRGSVKPVHGKKEILGGNIANQFAKRWPEDWEDMQYDIPFPIPFGRSSAISWDGDCPWRVIVLASTLHHVGERTDLEKQAIIRSAFSEALSLSLRHGVRSIATALLQGGWRLPLESALRVMLDTYRQSGPAVRQMNLILATTNPDEFRTIADIAAEYGF